MGERAQDDEQQQQTAGKKPLPSEITTEALKKAALRGDKGEVDRLTAKWQRERNAEKAERLAQEHAAEALKLKSADSAEQEEFAEEEQEEVRPEQVAVTVGGHPADTTDLTDIADLIRRDGEIEEVLYSGAKDGIVNLFSKVFHPRWDLRLLYESLILPDRIQDFQTTRDLFDDISSLLHKQVMLPTRMCTLLAYWAMATWFTEYLPFLPSVVISGPPSSADILFRTLAAVCRRPLLLGELNPSILHKLPIDEITPTLLIREPQ